jgi:hypothetical protein
MSYLLSDVIMKSERARATAAPARPFAGIDDIRGAITLSKNYRLDRTPPAQAHSLLFFQTPLQQTWLVKTPNRLYCILDDVRRPAPHVNWSMPMSDVIDADGNLKLGIEARETAGAMDTGLFDFGPNHKDWLYSRKLFVATGVEQAVGDFLRG